jgi:hypothetical protein
MSREVGAIGSAFPRSGLHSLAAAHGVPGDCAVDPRELSSRVRN